ncbi:MAG: hypothetical protein GTO18_04090 [Anaerolineales bacterium]|nr:hypothetical protein [Anaerolineales bacterium]
MEPPAHRKLGNQSATDQGSQRPVKVSSRSSRKRLFANYLWILVIALWIVAFVLGYLGLEKAALSQGESLTTLDLIYLDLQLVTLESGSIPGPVPWELQIARFALPALAAYTAIRALAILFREQTQYFRLRFVRDHVVICGLSRKGLLLARNLLAQDRKVVVIELDEGNDSIEQLRVRGAIVLTGDATDPAVLQHASIHRARYLIAVCEDDGTNAEIAVQTQNLIADLDCDPLTCFIHIVDPRLCDLLRENEIGGNAFPGLRLELFNVYERGAQLILEEYSPFELDGEERDDPTHVLLIGMGKMGENLATRIAYAWHSNRRSSNNPILLTVVDRQAEEKLKSLEARYPHLAACCQFFPLSMDVNSSGFYKAPFLTDVDKNGVRIAYICFDSDSLSLNVGLTLARLTRKQEIPIVMRMIEERGLALLLGNGMEDHEGFSNLHAFSLLDKTCTPELLFGGIHELLARSVYEDYARQQISLKPPIKGSDNLVPWDQLPEGIKNSNRRYADHISVKLRAVDCYLAPLRDWDAIEFSFSEPEVELMARMEHERWVRVQEREGWSYAEERDNARKVHPSLVVWEELPEVEKKKNRAFIRDLPRILAKAGFQIQRYP